MEEKVKEVAVCYLLSLPNLIEREVKGREISFLNLCSLLDGREETAVPWIHAHPLSQSV